MRKLLKLMVIFVFTVSLSLGLHANGLNLNSNGAKAMAMGGAFVGLADDYSAVFWNPAGLTQMKQASFSLLVADVIPDGSYKFDYAMVDATAEAKHYFNGALGYFKPLSDKVVAGIYVYVPSGLGATWDGAELFTLTQLTAYEWESMLGVVNISPAVAFKVSDTFSLGASLNLSYGLLKMKRPALGQYEEDLSGMAFSATVGMMFQPSEKFSLGFTFKTPFKAKLKGDATMAGAGIYGLPTTDDAEREANFPMWLAGGIAFKPNEKLTLTFDVQYTNWKKIDEIAVKYSDPGWILFFEDGGNMHLEWKDAVQIRCGMEYKTSEKFAIRAGYYYDPSPSPAKTMNILLPEITYNFFTFGFGYNTGKMNLDFGIEYGMGKDVEVGLMEGEMPGIHGMNILAIDVGVTFFL